jgi:hypothetical protein
MGAWAGKQFREQARQTHCANNLKQIGLALQNYHMVFDQFPQGAWPNDRLPPERRLGWPLTLPYFLFCTHCWGLDDFHEIDWSGPWDAGVASHYAVLPLEPLLCPGAPYQAAQGIYGGPTPVDRTHLTELVPATYIGLAGVGPDAPLLPAGHVRAGVFGYDRRTALGDIRDGASTTMMVAETSTLQAPWVSGGPATVRGLDPSDRPYIGPGCALGGNHPAGALVLLADGSVRVLSPGASPAVVEALTTIAGGESLPGDWTRIAPLP